MPKLTHALSLLGVTLCAALARAEPRAPTVTLQQEQGRIVFRASNPRTYPVTVLVEVDSLENMRSSVPLPAKLTLPAAALATTVVELSPRDTTQRWRYGQWRYRWIAGRHEAEHDARAIYQLPYAAGYAYWVIQGYDGAFSHQGQCALDFDLPLGTPVHAARAGRVVRVDQAFDRGGPEPALRDQANQVWIEHRDGTIARYVHLELGGAEVELGQRVRAGQRIARSGNTGFSKGPHLHFDVFVPDDEVRGVRTLSTPFETDAGTQARIAQGETPMRPPPRGQERVVPLNALTAIRFTQRAPNADETLDDVPAVTHFAPGETAYVILQIGARRPYDVRVHFHQGQRRRALAIETLTTGADWTRAWVRQDVNGLHLRGQPCRVVVEFDGEVVGEAEFGARR